MFEYLEIAISPKVGHDDQASYFTCMSILHHANLDEKQMKNVKEKIIRLIENINTRFSGLLLFETALKQETPFYVSKWPEIVIANLDSSPACKEVTHRIIKHIMQPATCEAHRATADFHIPQIINLIMKFHNSKNVSEIQSLASCFKASPGAAAATQEKFEPFIIEQMNSISKQYTEAVSDCFIRYLNGLAIATGNKNSQSYNFSYKKILYTLQHIINKLFCTNDVLFMDNDEEGVEVFKLPQKSKDGSEEFNLSEISDKEFVYMMKLGRVYETLAYTAAKMICFPSEDKRPFEVDILWILEFINKILDVTKHGLNPSSAKHFALLKVIYPLIHRGTMKILESLIANFSLIHQVENILMLFRKSIELTYSFTYSSTASCLMRYTTWKTLGIWFDKDGLQVSLPTGNNEYLIDELIKDIAPDAVERKPPTFSQKNPNSKTKSVDRAVFPFNLDYYSKIRTDIFRKAQTIFHGIVVNALSFLAENIKEKLGKAMITTLNAINHQYLRDKKFPLPYTCMTSRMKIYEISHAFLISSTSSISLNMQIFSAIRKGLKDPSFQVKSHIQMSIPTYRLMLHPKKKFPEVQMRSNNVFKPEPTVEESICHWESVNTVNISQVDHGNQPAVVSDVHTDLSSETHNNMGENVRQSNYALEKEYCVSDYERQYVKEDIQCNGEDMMEVAVSTSQSGSESEEDCNSTAEDENLSESACKPFITSVHSANEIKEKEIVLDGDEESEEVSAEDEEDDDEEEEDEEENEYVQEEEIESVSSNVEKAVIRKDQNGMADVSEDEIISLSKGENGEFSSEEDSFEEDCIGEFHEEQVKEDNEMEEIESAPPSKKHCSSDEIEEILETAPPSKKPRLDEEVEEAIDASPPSIKTCLTEEIIDGSPPSDKPHLSEEVIETEPPSRIPFLNEEMAEAEPPSKEPGLKHEEQEEPVQEEIITNSSTEEVSIAKVKEDEEEQLLRWSHQKEPKKESDEDGRSQSPILTYDEMCADLQMVESDKLVTER